MQFDSPRKSGFKEIISMANSLKCEAEEDEKKWNINIPLQPPTNQISGFALSEKKVLKYGKWKISGFALSEKKVLKYGKW